MQRLPIVPVTLFGRHESRQTEAYVDSGATYRIFDRHLAGEIGLDPTQGRRQLFRYKRDRTMLHFCGRIAFRVDIGNFLEFKRAFQGYRKIKTPAQVEKICRVYMMGFWGSW